MSGVWIEPLKASECPHKPGTPEHGAWIHENVVERQSNPYTAANHNERDRIDRLIRERAERLNTTWAQRSRALDEMIADLPVPGVPLPPDVPNFGLGWVTGYQCQNATTGAWAPLVRDFLARTYTADEIRQLEGLGDDQEPEP